jgi:hypothetical protein
MASMRVRVWIAGAEGPSWDFELLTPPRPGERITLSHGGRVEEGVVVTVDWHFQAMETSGNGLGLDGEPAGSVSLVQVICRPSAEVISGAFEAVELDAPAGEPREAG